MTEEIKKGPLQKLKENITQIKLEYPQKLSEVQ